MYSAQEINGCRPDSRVGGSECLILDEINVWFDIESGEENKGTEITTEISKCTHALQSTGDGY